MKRRWVVWGLVAASLAGCGDPGEAETPEATQGPADEAHDAHDDHEGHGVELDPNAEERLLDPFLAEGERVERRLSPNATVEQAVTGTCTTATIKPLSEQLLEEVECLRPGTLSRIDGMPGVGLTVATIPYLQRGAAQALARAASRRSMTITSATRTLPQQYLLYRWFLAGRCGISLAARPGTSNHEGGLAVDVSNYGSARSALRGQGYIWLGGSDPVHFDYGPGGANLRGLSVLAFQRLHNRNRPDAPLLEDGVYGPSTAAAIAAAPAAGFARGASCLEPVAPEPEPEPEDTGAPARPDTNLFPIETYWSRQASGAYELRALADGRVTRVVYTVDGYKIGEATRTQGANFPAAYTFSQEGQARYFAVKGYDADDTLVAWGDGLIDVTSGAGVFVRQLGGGLYDVGLERPDAEVDAIEVDADGYPLFDTIEGSYRPRRKVARYTFTQPGERALVIRTYDASGALLETIERTFTVTAGTPTDAQRDAPSIAFAAPAGDGASNPVTFAVDASPTVASVRYVADGRWELGTSDDAGSSFALTFTFSTLGLREIEALGLDADGDVVVRTTRTLDVAE